ncbi:SMI1/KNR4 family protein [Streptomyces scabiei]|uniref:SMI1/KNR4 family protein n=1 Tax=Streptomyces TaxID=1883 RepID=UPI0029B8CA51|nr:SMI1/KNR4 family protein [Streptomyces scabiei]MDX3114635.1 SMI1/KNR4 family protein [Streptomyces scabiei]
MSQEVRIHHAWTRIIKWLQENAPRHAEAINPGVDQSMIDAAEEDMATTLPPELQTWLLLNNGSTAKDVLEGCLYQPHSDSVFLPGDNVFLDLGRVVDEYRDLLAGGTGWQPEWIPFSRQSDAPYGYFLDAGADSAQAPVMYFAEAALPKLAFPSLADFLEATADALEGRGEIRALGNRVPYQPAIDKGFLRWKRAESAP